MNLALRVFVFSIAAALLWNHYLEAADWPQWRGPNRDGVWNEPNALDEFDAASISMTWRAPISSGYTGPTVAGGRVYVMDRIDDPNQIERVLCFDASTGNEIWQVSYDCPYIGIGYVAGPRASVSVDGDRAYALGAMGNIHCLKTQKRRHPLES